MAARFGLDLQATLIFDNPTPVNLAAYIAAELAQRSGSSRSGSSGPTIGPALGEMLPVAQPSLRMPMLSKQELQQQLADLVSETTGAAVGSADQPLMEAGVDSIAAVELRCELTVFMGCDGSTALLECWWHECAMLGIARQASFFAAVGAGMPLLSGSMWRRLPPSSSTIPALPLWLLGWAASWQLHWAAAQQPSLTSQHSWRASLLQRGMAHSRLLRLRVCPAASQQAPAAALACPASGSRLLQGWMCRRWSRSASGTQVNGGGSL